MTQHGYSSLYQLYCLFLHVVHFIKYKTQFSLVVLFFSSFALANHSIVYLFGRVQPRYLIYSDFALLVIIF